MSTSDNIDVPVLIVGGGGCGLSTSIFLSDMGIQNILFEKHSTTSLLPRAHYINQRTMEIFRQHDIAERIKAVGSPIRNMSRTDWRTSMGGDGPYDGRLIATVPAFGGQIGTADFETYREHGAELSSNLPLVRAEPILRQIAEERNPGRVLFNHTVLDFEEQADHIRVTIEDPNGSIITCQAKYLIGADAGKTIGPKIGIEMQGPRNLVDFISVYFKADLSEYADDRTLITHFINPEGEKMEHFNSGVLVKVGPTWDRHSEEWLMHFGVPLEEVSKVETDSLAPRVRELLKLPDLKMEVIRVSHWVLERTLASKYSQGRIFIAGDAAHKRPPTTGLGLNTAIEDALNIAWKLAFVLQGKADTSLLDTYATERRPVGERNVDWGLFTFSNYPVLQAAVGFVPGQEKFNKARLARIFEESPLGEITRHQLRRIFATQDIEFCAHNIELGFSYPNGATIPDGTAPPQDDPSGKLYVPTTRPGHRLPHAWIERDGRVLSTHDLIGNGRDQDLLLITDEVGDAWVQASKRASSDFKINIGTACIRTHLHSRKSGLYRDHEDVWNKVRGFAEGGAILVRPDNFVLWRSIGQSATDGAELLDAVQNLSRKNIQLHVPISSTLNQGSQPYHLNGGINGI